MCRSTTTSTNNNNNSDEDSINYSIHNQHDHHLFYKDLTSTFMQSCSSFIYEGNTFAVSPRRRLFDEDFDDVIANNNNTNNDDDDDDDDDCNGMNAKSKEIKKKNEIPFLNLLASQEEENNIRTMQPQHSCSSPSHNDDNDPWTQNAMDIFLSINDKSILLSKNYLRYTKQFDILFQSYNVVNNNDKKGGHVSAAVVAAEAAWTMSSQKCSLFESTLVSFLTKTTKEIETLRLRNNHQYQNNQHRHEQEQEQYLSSTMYHHRNGIISNLFSQLKVITNSYTNMQLLRNRTSLSLLDDPLQVCIVNSSSSGSATTVNRGVNGDPGTNAGNEDDGDDDELEQIPLFQYDNNEDDKLHNENKDDEMILFMNRYDHILNEDDYDDTMQLIDILNQPLPAFPMNHEEIHVMHNMQNSNKEKTNQLRPIKEEERRVENGKHDQGVLPNSAQPLSSTTATTTQYKNEYIPSLTSTSANDDITNEIQQQLQQETIFLTNKIQNESLDSVQKVESQMIEITTLLNQFTSLINDQQVEIDIIHESTVLSKENLEKGSEQLIRAKDRKKKSRHYFAWIIIVLGLLLLFFNAIIP